MRNAASLVLFAAVAAGSTVPASAATNGLDAGFGSGGIALFGATSNGGTIYKVASIKVLPDGKIVLAGRTTATDGPGVGRTLAAIGRLDGNGSWDDQFADHGLFVLPYGVAAAADGAKLDDVGLLSDGRIVASGGAYQPSDYFYSCTVLIELTAGGSLDGSFAPDHSGAYCFDFAPPPAPPGSYWIGHFDALRVAGDDSFFLSSVSTNLDRGAIAHLDATGDLVATYGTNGIAALPTGIHTYLLPSASASGVVTAGVALGNSGTQCAGAAALGAGGAIETGYGTQGKAAADCKNGEAGPISAVSDPLGRVLIASDDFDGVDYLPYRLVRLTASGEPDATFNSSGQQPGTPGVAVPPVSGSSTYDYAIAAHPLPDGHIIAVGDAGYATPGDGSTFNIALLRFNEDASYDASFGNGAHPGWTSLNIGGLPNSSGVASAFTLDAAGRAYVAIETSDANGAFCNGILRLIPDRLHDNGFDAPAPMPTCPQ